MHVEVFCVSCCNQRLQSPLHSLSKPKYCFGHSYFSTNMQVIIKRTYISKTSLPVLCWTTGFVRPILLGKDGSANQENLILMSLFSILFYSRNKYCKYLGVYSESLAIPTWVISTGFIHSNNVHIDI